MKQLLVMSLFFLLFHSIEAASLRVSVSVPPEAYLVKAVGGDAVMVDVIVKEGDSPHAFVITPRRIAAVARSDIYFTIGLPFERRLLEKLSSSNRRMKSFDISKGVKRRKLAPDRGGGRVEELDPHIWLDPLIMMRMAGNVCSVLVSVDTVNKSLYERNLDLTLKRLRLLDAGLSRVLKPLKGGRFYVFHPAFGYFADRYGLVQEAVEIDGKSPGPRGLARLIRRAKQDRVKLIFVQKQFSDSTARKLAEAVGGIVIPLDPLSGDYENNMRLIAAEIARLKINP